MSFSSTAILEISDFVVNSFGLQFPPSRENDLMRAVKNAAFQFGCTDDLGEIKHWLCDRKLSDAEVHELSAQLTINETYFFREKTALDLLSETIIPAIIAKRDINKQPIRIWSAGCSSGEEAYSIAMWLSEHFNQINPKNLQLIATDISPRAVAKALKGEYTNWSFRETDIEIRKKYFIETGKNYQLKNEIQKFVTFSYLNLAKNSFPSTITNTDNIDVIFCRNVLMYFRPDKIREVSARFYDALTADGWLITSQVELNDDYFGNFERVNYRNGIYYSKEKNQKSAVSVSARLASILVDKKPKSVSVKANVRQRPVNDAHKQNNLFNTDAIYSNSKPLFELKSIEANEILAEINEVKHLCDKGEYGLAIERIENLIVTNASNADLYYLYANILYENNDLLGVEKLLTKTLYLNNRHFDAILLMAYTLKQRGLFAQSSIYFKQAELILSTDQTMQNVDTFQLLQSVNNEILNINAV